MWAVYSAAVFKWTGALEMRAEEKKRHFNLFSRYYFWSLHLTVKNVKSPAPRRTRLGGCANQVRPDAQFSLHKDEMVEKNSRSFDGDTWGHVLPKPLAVGPVRASFWTLEPSIVHWTPELGWWYAIVASFFHKIGSSFYAKGIELNTVQKKKGPQPRS